MKTIFYTIIMLKNILKVKKNNSYNWDIYILIQSIKQNFFCSLKKHMRNSLLKLEETGDLNKAIFLFLFYLHTRVLFIMAFEKKFTPFFLPEIWLLSTSIPLPHNFDTQIISHLINHQDIFRNYSAVDWWLWRVVGDNFVCLRL